MLVTGSCGLLCCVAGIGMWASDLGCAHVGSGHLLFGPLVYILMSWLGVSVDKCPRCGLGEVSCPGDGDRLCHCGSEYWGGSMHHPVSCVTCGGVGGLHADCVIGIGGGFLHADCVTGGVIVDCVLDGPAPGVVLGLFLQFICHDSSIARCMFCVSSSSESWLGFVVIGTLPIFMRALLKLPYSHSCSHIAIQWLLCL